MRILVIDNYDSFTYNLVYILRQLSTDVSVFRNDKISPDACLEYDAIVLSPGPGIPKDAGNLMAIIVACAGHIPLLGVCLGHQAIAQYLGGSLEIMSAVFHGVQSTIKQTSKNNELFTDLPESFPVGRYHSWNMAATDTSNFEVSATCDEGNIMAIHNTEQKLYGIQFHPESILTPKGDLMIQNFLSISKNLKK